MSGGDTTLDLLRAVGEMVFGPKWADGMAEALGVSRRRAQRWLELRDEPRDPREAPPDSMLPELLALLRRQRGSLDALAQRVKEAVDATAPRRADTAGRMAALIGHERRPPPDCKTEAERAAWLAGYDRHEQEDGAE